MPLFTAPLLGGTTRAPHTLIIAALCGGAGVLAAAAEVRRGRPLRLSWFSALLALAVGLCLLQLVPLPPGLRAHLSPGRDADLRHILGDLGGYPGRPFPVSLDPPDTAHEAVRLGGYLCLLLAAGSAFSQRGDGTRLLRGVYVSAGLVALCGLLHALHVPLPPLVEVSGATRALLPAAFVNANHMAALLAIGAILATADASGRGTPWSRRAPLLLLCALLDAALLGTLSRGGIAVGLLGQAVVLLWPQGGERGAVTLRRRLTGLVAAGGLGLLGLLFFHEARQDLGQRLSEMHLAAELATPGSKLHAWGQALPLLRGHWALGVGRGAFALAFAGASDVGARVRFPYLENEWLQAVTDFGVPGALALLALLGVAVGDAIGRVRMAPRRQPLRIAALCALVALGLHNVVDFNLEAGGVAVCAVALCAAVARRRVAVPAVLLLAAAALVVAGAGWVAWRAPGHDEAERHLLALAQDPAASTEVVVAAGRDAELRHPLDSYLSDVVAARLWADRRPGAMMWINRALLANPHDLEATRQSARVLAAYGHRSQAALALRAAIPQGNYEQRVQLYRTAQAALRAPADFIQALPPSGAIADEVLDVLGAGPAPDWPLVAAVAEWGLGVGASGALRWRTTAALSQHDVEGVARWAPRLVQAGQGNDLPAFLVAGCVTFLMEAGRVQEAADLCAAARRRVPPGTGFELTVALAQVRERQGAVAEARALLDAALGEAEGAAQQVAVHEARADLEERQGNLHSAQLERMAAARLRAE